MIRYSGCLYQLVSRFELSPGSYVKVNGPHDTYGRVQSSQQREDGYLNLIRGAKAAPGEKPVYTF